MKSNIDELTISGKSEINKEEGCSIFTVMHRLESVSHSNSLLRLNEPKIYKQFQDSSAVYTT